jgi:hypothetical protein
VNALEPCSVCGELTAGYDAELRPCCDACAFELDDRPRKTSAPPRLGTAAVPVRGPRRVLGDRS